MGAALAPYYLWLKAIHIIAIIAWMGPMLVLPPVFARLAGLAPGDPGATPLHDVARRLVRFMTVGMVAAWIVGILLIVATGAMKQGWFHGKLLLVILLSGGHGFLAASRKKLEAGQPARSDGFWRAASGVAGVGVLVVVVLAVVKPF